MPKVFYFTAVYKTLKYCVFFYIKLADLGPVCLSFSDFGVCVCSIGLNTRTKIKSHETQSSLNFSLRNTL
jgi:hypothetical protein